MHVLNQLFRSEDLQSHGVLVLTHWDGEIGEEEESLTQWIGNDPEIKHMVGLFARVILTNNQLSGRGAYQCRAKCLRELLVLWQRTLSVKDFVIRSGESSVPVFAGECAVCTEQIEMYECAHLPCNHSFHNECLSSQSACPLCRQPFVGQDVFSLSGYFGG